MKSLISVLSRLKILFLVVGAVFLLNSIPAAVHADSNKWEEKKEKQEKKWEAKKQKHEKKKKKHGKNHKSEEYEDDQHHEQEPPAVVVIPIQQRPSIKKIISNRAAYLNHTVRISGKVVEILGLQYTNVGVFRVSDGSGSIWVIPSVSMPAKGESVEISGKLESGVKLTNINVGLVIREH